MLTTATVQTTESNYSAGSQSPLQPQPARSARASATRTSKLLTEVQDLHPADTVPNLLVPSLTGAQVLAPDLAGTQHSVISIARAAAHPVAQRDQKTQLSELPRPKRLVTSFEPHFRRSTIGRLQSSISNFKGTLGQPGAATSQTVLRAILTDIYRQTALSAETRNLASIMSLLQDFLRPHWSQISAQKLDRINEGLGWVATQPDLSSHTIERFYRELAGVVDSRIVIEAVEDEEEEGEGEEEDDADFE
jgi:hypothetical protein